MIFKAIKNVCLLQYFNIVRYQIGMAFKFLRKLSHMSSCKNFLQTNKVFNFPITVRMCPLRNQNKFRNFFLKYTVYEKQKSMSSQGTMKSFKELRQDWKFNNFTLLMHNLFSMPFKICPLLLCFFCRRYSCIW